MKIARVSLSSLPIPCDGTLRGTEIQSIRIARRAVEICLVRDGGALNGPVHDLIQRSPIQR